MSGTPTIFIFLFLYFYENFLYCLHFLCIMKNKEKDIKEQVHDGKILSKVILEVAGKPKEHVENSLKDLVDIATKSKVFGVISYQVYEAKEIESIWSTFAELELLSTMQELVGFCFDFMPSSIEIIEPEEINIQSRELTGIYNDLLGKLHTVQTQTTKLQFQTNNAGKNMGKLVKKTLMLILSGRKLKKEELASTIGINAKKLEPILDVMVKEGNIKKTKTLYSLK